MKNEDKKSFFYDQLKAFFRVIDKNLVTGEQEDAFIAEMWEVLTYDNDQWLIPGWEKEYKDPK